ncbi:MAG: hypothetical protein QOE70_982 [Chthoniobacter sp.]|jgi:hypothetical protein|nr:hypothetical protein [Chthoniobacter sp.]
MEPLIDLLTALLAFLVLLGTGAWAFGARLGGLARGAAVPLLAVPLLSDWLRFAVKLPFATAFALAAGLCVVASVSCGVIGRAPRSDRTLDNGHWWLALAVLAALHVVMRCWLVTERGPNPADDGLAGYKSLALLNSISWPTIHPEAPELPLSYYYYAYCWPASLATLGVSLKIGWWMTAVVLCVVGGMLALEAVLPRLRTRADVGLASVTIGAGASFAFVLGIAQRLPLRAWLQEVSFLTAKFGLYMRVPQTVCGYWAPFSVFASGVLLVATLFLFDLIRLRWDGARFAWTVLGIAGLAGYCTFHLLGFAVVVVPILIVTAWLYRREGGLRRGFVGIGALGIGSAFTTLPLLLDLAQRQTGTRYDRFRDPLLVWLQTALDKYSVFVVLGLGLWTLTAVLLSNVLLVPLLARWRKERPSPENILLFSIFAVGTGLCFFGVTDDFVPKFGGFVATTLIVAFLGSGPWLGGTRCFWIAAVVVPVLIVLNTVRANVASPRWDGAWRAIDTTARSGEVVLYDVAVTERRKRNPWQSVIPFFARARFLVPADQVDDQGQNFLRDPAALQALPPTGTRLARMVGDAPSYLLLTTPGGPPVGEELYRSELFSLQRITRRAPMTPSP